MKKGILFVIICIISLLLPTTSYQEVDTTVPTKSIEVNVEGEVEISGVYQLNQGDMETLLTKVQLTPLANCKCIDMQRKLYDGDQVYIPSKQETKISLNQATKEELMTIKGIGQKKAEAILEYRALHNFTSIEQIQEIKGIGQKSYLKWRSYLCL